MTRTLWNLCGVTLLFLSLKLPVFLKQRKLETVPEKLPFGSDTLLHKFFRGYLDVLCRRDTQNEEIKCPFLQEFIMQWEGWAGRGKRFQMAEKLRKGPEVGNCTYAWESRS